MRVAADVTDAARKKLLRFQMFMGFSQRVKNFPKITIQQEMGGRIE